MIDHSLVTGFTMLIRRSFDMACFGIFTYHRHEPPLLGFAILLSPLCARRSLALHAAASGRLEQGGATHAARDTRDVPDAPGERGSAPRLFGMGPRLPAFLAPLGGNSPAAPLPMHERRSLRAPRSVCAAEGAR